MSDRKSDEEAAGTHIPIARERVVLGKRKVEKVAAHLDIRTHAEDVTVSEPLQTEHVDVERVAIDRITDVPPEVRTEGAVTIVPVVEEVLVRQFRIVEEIRLTRRSETVEHTETVTLRRQEVVDASQSDRPIASTDDDRA
ncbi:hypothetical protein OCGS_1402 [Oceaniovalibus guishaninsula JLT2003]|uniref:DUF2382 domain-containing protein n=1 Tax=Oceaniovalibus guishaninsula JLT2003 TaxID=1231392 RepID=K2HNX7_9RHOB|nr:DUF2382 domain-containing protein [Oceaniovalibus guishaninsula]EKE44564.1 hypothetical protein OCGS_1402 [Oceaniovalibus guishaninsula JLT2003]